MPLNYVLASQDQEGSDDVIYSLEGEDADLFKLVSTYDMEDGKVVDTIRKFFLNIYSRNIY